MRYLTTKKLASLKTRIRIIIITTKLRIYRSMSYIRCQMVD